MAKDPRNYIKRRLLAQKAANPDRPMVQTQVDRVLKVFGGVVRLHEALKAVGDSRSIVSIYRWNHPRSKGGRGGVIPSTAMPAVLAAARFQGMVLSVECLDPRPSITEKIEEAELIV